jgi:hypothetical protein
MTPRPVNAGKGALAMVLATIVKLTMQKIAGAHG